MAQSNKFTIFFTGQLGQGYLCDFVVDEVEYHSALQYMCHQKALLLGTPKLAADILNTNQIRDYYKILESMPMNRSKIEKWESSCEEIIYRGNLAKFDKHPSLRQKLLESVGTTLVFADKNDLLLGVGLREKEPDVYDANKWRGKNFLGNVLTKIRDSFSNSIEWTFGNDCQAPWSKDGKFYDASIVMMHPDKRTCTVRYYTDNSEEIQQLSCLLPAKSSTRSPGGKFATPRSNKRTLHHHPEEDWDKEAVTPTKMRSGASRSQERVKFTFFWTGSDILSQWYITKFQVDGMSYNCAEQFMMHQKAVFFNDVKMAEDIMAAKRPVHQKELGRKVTGYDDHQWNGVCKEIVKKGNIAKFSQNPKLGKYLLATGNSILAEASPHDQKWGIGLSADDPRARNPEEWRGDNLLGEVLMEVREELLRSDTLFDTSLESENPVADAEEGYTLFWRSLSPFSQWHPAFFTIKGIEYNCAEQYMMHQKAVFFNDENCARNVMRETDPRKQKQIARGVHNFDETKWNEVSRDFVRQGSMGKYSQNPDLRRELFATANSVLVEASADDTRWGIGATKDDRQSWTRRTWRGENWLGDILTDVRNELMKEEKNMDMSNRIRRATDGNSFRTFSLPQSPFHLFYPAEIKISGSQFHSAGHYIVYSLAVATGSQKSADRSRQIVDSKPLVTILHNMLAGIESWRKDLDDKLLEVNRAKFDQHQDLMEKLLDTAEDYIVYSGTDRHLGIDYELQCYGCAEHENHLGKTLMKIRNNILNSSCAPVKFSDRFVRHEDRRRRGNGDSWGNGSTPQSTPRGSDRRGNDDNWSVSGTPRSTVRGNDRKGNNDQWGSVDTFQSTSRGSDRRGNKDHWSSVDTPQTQSTSRQRNDDDYWDDASTPRNTQNSAEGKATKSRVQHGFNDTRVQHGYGDVSGKTNSHMINVDSRRNTSTEEQKQYQKHLPKHDKVFSDSSNPFHLWYPAEVVIDDIRYHCIGQRLLHLAARGIFKDSKLEKSVLKTANESQYSELEEKCDDDREWTDLVRENLAELIKTKFVQNKQLRRVLNDTQDSQILFASTDRILGTGCNAEDIGKEKKWRGKNYLGKALVEFRNSRHPQEEKEEEEEEVSRVVQLQSSPTKSIPAKSSTEDCDTLNSGGGGNNRKGRKHREQTNNNRSKKGRCVQVPSSSNAVLQQSSPLHDEPDQRSCEVDRSIVATEAVTHASGLGKIASTMRDERYTETRDEESSSRTSDKHSDDLVQNEAQGEEDIQCPAVTSVNGVCDLAVEVMLKNTADPTTPTTPTSNTDVDNIADPTTPTSNTDVDKPTVPPRGEGSDGLGSKNDLSWEDGEEQKQGEVISNNGQLLVSKEVESSSVLQQSTLVHSENDQQQDELAKDDHSRTELTSENVVDETPEIEERASTEVDEQDTSIRDVGTDLSTLQLDISTRDVGTDLPTTVEHDDGKVVTREEEDVNEAHSTNKIDVVESKRQSASELSDLSLQDESLVSDLERMNFASDISCIETKNETRDVGATNDSDFQSLSSTLLSAEDSLTMGRDSTDVMTSLHNGVRMDTVPGLTGNTCSTDVVELDPSTADNQQHIAIGRNGDDD